MMKLKTVPLTNGNVVVDLDCPPKLVKVLPTIGGVQHGEHGEMVAGRKHEARGFVRVLGASRFSHAHGDLSPC